MNTNIDPRPITSFDDLIAITEAEREEIREWSAASKARGVFLWMPLLMILGLVTVLACAAYWWGRYWDEVLQGVLFLVTLMGG